MSQFFIKTPWFLLGVFLCLTTSCEEELLPPVLSQTQRQPQLEPKEGPASPAGEIRFLSYNLKNWLTMTRLQKDGSRLERKKPEAEKAAVVSLITSARPDILGLCEIGTPADLSELQSRLKSAGLDLPFTHHTGGYDNTRFLAMLSRFPIARELSKDRLTFSLDGKTWQMRRGLLHTVLNLPGGPTHFLGTHFKSKRESRSYDQALFRLNEALLTREQALKIQERQPEARILIYGDFNDTRRSPTLSRLKGRRNSSHYFEDLELRDSRGEFWTHFWSYQHQYSRFDYLLASKALKPHLNLESSYIVDRDDWYAASDHRALLLVLRN